jgi:hypothetical protein
MRQRMAEGSDIVRFFTVQVERGFIIRSAKAPKGKKTKYCGYNKYFSWV